MIGEAALRGLRHPVYAAMIAWAAIGATVFAWNMVRPFFRMLVFSSPRLYQTVLARVKQANIISRHRPDPDGGDSEYNALDLQFIVEYEQGAKSIRSELRNIYSGNQAISGACPQPDNAGYLRCVIQAIRAFAPNSAFTFKAVRSSQFPLDTAKAVMAEFDPGAVDAPLSLRICRFMPGLNEYSLNHKPPSWKYFWVRLAMAACLAPVPLILFGSMAFSKPEAIPVLIGLHWKWCSLAVLMTLALLGAISDSGATPPKQGYAGILPSSPALPSAFSERH